MFAYTPAHLNSMFSLSIYTRHNTNVFKHTAVEPEQNFRLLTLLSSSIYGFPLLIKQLDGMKP
jgi:hypothetical protein